MNEIKTNKISKLIFIAFCLICFIQLGSLGFLIKSNEIILSRGKDFVFKTVPVDPFNPFMGRYVQLGFEEENILLDDLGSGQTCKDFQPLKKAFVSIEKDKDGFAKVVAISKVKPKNTRNYITTSMSYCYAPSYTANNKEEIHLNFPFDRFYVQEDLAPEIERKTRDRKNTGLATVRVSEGRSLLTKLEIVDVETHKPIN